ncbi:MAG: CoA-binding protein [Bacteroidetes bacterium]|nr:CoA-binding protein [Bacteroidota bacterium]
MASLQQIEQFTAQKHIAVAGISRTPHKFGNSVFKELKKQGYNVYPVSLHLNEFEGVSCYKDIASLPDQVSSIIINTKPAVTAHLLADARNKGIQNIWLQQGAADKEMISSLAGATDNLISGHCLLMFTKPSHFMHRTHAFLSKVFGSFPK